MVFSFDNSLFNRIFPFYILVDEDLAIHSMGKTLEKVCLASPGMSFFENFKILRPYPESEDFKGIKDIGGQLVVIECINNRNIKLRGQIEVLEASNQLIFLGSPWFDSMEQVVENKLSIKDFAFHDPIIDLLHVFKNQEITNNELKQLLNTVNRQKEDLKKATKEIQDIALFPTQNPDPLIRIDTQGNILRLNPAAEKLTQFDFEDKSWAAEDFWKLLAQRLDPALEREVFEAVSSNKYYSFVVIPIRENAYFNIYGRDVSQQKKDENQIKLLAKVASANENGVIFTNEQGVIYWCNKAAELITGYTNEEIIGKTPLNLLMGTLSDKKVVHKMLDDFTQKRPFHYELIQYCKDGSWYWGKTMGQPFHFENGEVHFFLIIEDISLHKQKENELMVLSSIAEKNTHAVVISNKDGIVEWVNKSFEKMTGYSAFELLNTKPGKFLQGKDTDPESVKYISRQIKAGEPFICEMLNYHKSGRPYWVRIQGQALKDDKGDVVKYFAIEEDITQKKESEEKIREFERKFRIALEKIGDNVWEYDFRTRRTYFSKSFNEFLGVEITDENENDKLWWDSVYPDDKSILIENDRKTRNGEIDSHTLEYRIIDKLGNIRWVLDRGVVTEKNESGLPLKITGTHTNITDRKKFERTLKANEEKYRGIIANMNLGLMEIDVNQRITYANKQFCEMAEMAEDQIIGVDANLFLTPESVETVRSKAADRQRGIAEAYELEVSINGKKGWWFVSTTPKFNEGGEFIGSTIITLDINERKRLEQQLILAREKAEQLGRTKERFLANMSHEIRTPMNAIIGMSNQLAKTTLENEQRMYLRTIQSASDNLLIIINDILDFSKIEAGKLDLEHIGFEPREIINQCIQVMMYKAQEKGISFTNPIYDTRIARVLKGDPFRINQVILNLVSNAIKFTEKGGVYIMCELLKDNPTSQKIKISVQDTGIGMDEVFVSQIFEKFTQEYKSGSRKYGGTGLGMSISKDLMELMGGTITVDSQKGTGTTISIIVELEKGVEADLPQKESVQITNNFLSGKKVLVVDDNDHNRLVASIILQNYGAVTKEAINGEEALNILSMEPADLVLMDIQMPIMNGYEATTIIRESGSSIPIIAITANAIKGESEKCIAAGMNDYISKPFKEEEFVNTIAKWTGSGQVGLPQIKEEEPVAVADKLYDLESLKAFSRGNDAFLVQVVKIFCDQTPREVEQMISAYSNNDLQGMGAIAHKIKPNLDNFNIITLKNDIRWVETNGKDNINHPDLKITLDKIQDTVKVVVTEMKKDFPAV